MLNILWSKRTACQQQDLILSNPHVRILYAAKDYVAQRDSLSLLHSRSVLPMFHDDIDEQPRFGESQARDVLEVTELESASCLFVACRLFARARCLMCSHGSDGIEFVVLLGNLKLF